MHLCFVPLTQDNRLSAKEVIGGRDKLVEWQDFIDSIPQDLREQLKERYEAQLEQEHQFRY